MKELLEWLEIQYKVGRENHAPPGELMMLSSIIDKCEKLLAVEEVDKWISVETDLPKEDGEYIVAFTSGETRARFFNFQERTFYRDDVNINSIVTHWQPLPSAPKQDKQK